VDYDQIRITPGCSGGGGLECRTHCSTRRFFITQEADQARVKAKFAIGISK
jgi:hypothetical protein